MVTMVNPYQSMALSDLNIKRCLFGLALLLACVFGYGCDETQTSECVTDACLVDASMDVLTTRDVRPDRDDMRTSDAQPLDAHPDGTTPRPSGCVHCHRNADGSGILNAHPFGTAALSCIDCHGGNPEEYEDPERAHVQMPAELGPVRIRLGAEIIAVGGVADIAGWRVTGLELEAWVPEPVPVVVVRPCQTVGERRILLIHEQIAVIIRTVADL